MALSIISEKTWKDIFPDQSLDNSRVNLKTYTYGGAIVHFEPEECACGVWQPVMYLAFSCGCWKWVLSVWSELAG